MTGLLDSSTMPRPVSQLLRALGLLAYLGVTLVVFVVAAYVSFSLFVRSGTRPAPDVVGLTVEEAGNVLADQGLELERSATALADDEVPAGRVLRQNPAPRALVKRGSQVEVVLSLGPETVEVPELVGKALATAHFTLTAADLDLGKTLTVLSDEPPGTVVEQRPAVGEAVAPSTEVDLLVAGGEAGTNYVMPDLIYEDYDRVRDFFERRGFRLGSVRFERYEGVRPNVILRQFPLAGHPVTENDTLSLVVAAPPNRSDGRPGAGLGG